MLKRDSQTSRKEIYWEKTYQPAFCRKYRLTETKGVGTSRDHNSGSLFTIGIQSDHLSDLKEDFYEMNKLYKYKETLTCIRKEVM